MWRLDFCTIALVLLAGETFGFPEILLRTFSEGGGRAMVLPLALSSSDSTRRSAEASRFRLRELQMRDPSVPNARMPLYDDLLTNGYYTTRLHIGTPPQDFALIVDSGSTVTYVPCSTCARCGTHQARPDPRFQPEHSRTYKPVKCNIDCPCDKKKLQCTYERKYAEMSSSSGVLGEDTISFGKYSDLKAQRLVFGCENSETGDLFSQHADGIMGLGRGHLSIIDQLVNKGAIGNSFSLCYGGMDFGGGSMILGEISPPSGTVFSHSDPGRSPYYNVELKEIHVAGKLLPLNPKIFDRKHGTILDSGTTYAYLPPEAFRELKDADDNLSSSFRNKLMSKLDSLEQVDGPDPNYKDVCFLGAGRDSSQLSKSFPEIDMIFDKGQKLKLSPENYLFRGAYCLGFFQNGNDPTTLLGGIVVRNTLVTYDRQNHKIGFLKTNCSESWDKLHSSNDGPPPVEFVNATTNIAPSLSPIGSKSDLLPAFVHLSCVAIVICQDLFSTAIIVVFQLDRVISFSFSGQLQIGIIYFDMFLNVAYSALTSHIKELEELIARDLEVNSLQVHLLKFTSKGNGTLLKWAIFPASPSDSISNIIALAIISRLTEHRFRLPETFGSYEVIQWNVEPPASRTWWQQHMWFVGLGISAAVALGFTTLLVWYLWRHKSTAQAVAYRPVDAAAPEQEMQPL
ncbi:Aspartic proteinase-like protein 2 [Apostasia shenzhenica]|uniref:Aspartic proteinase-like protein 2 n=1 Tax=Apostasia shenzhenica TaxID=1088818 RepID=A0A2I0AWF1_9ASPA|nr:Aspartic proteinase-like protein 2 [Apostasia shenzhenica]